MIATTATAIGNTLLRHVAGGNRNRDIAQTLVISEETVKVHMKHIMRKLGANDRTQAIVFAARRGIIHLNRSTFTAGASGECVRSSGRRQGRDKKVRQ